MNVAQFSNYFQIYLFFFLLDLPFNLPRENYSSDPKFLLEKHFLTFLNYMQKFRSKF